MKTIVTFIDEKGLLGTYQFDGEFSAKRLFEEFEMYNMENLQIIRVDRED